MFSMTAATEMPRSSLPSPIPPIISISYVSSPSNLSKAVFVWYMPLLCGGRYGPGICTFDFCGHYFLFCFWDHTLQSMTVKFSYLTCHCVHSLDEYFYFPSTSLLLFVLIYYLQNRMMIVGIVVLSHYTKLLVFL